MTLPNPPSDTPTLSLAKGALVPAATEVLLKRIVSGEFAEDPSSFPKEADLVAQYGVSRTVIREALRILEEKGLVRIHQGRGTAALGVESWNIFDPQIVAAMIANDPDLEVVGSLYEIRAAVEADMARRAAESMSEQHRTALGHALSEMGQHLDEPGRYLALDRAFHDVIMDASGNRFGKRLVHNVFAWAGRDIFASDGSTLFQVTPDRVRQSQADHERIHDLILAGEGGEAAEAMRAHVLHSWSLTRDAALKGAG